MDQPMEIVAPARNDARYRAALGIVALLGLISSQPEYYQPPRTIGTPRKRYFD